MKFLIICHILGLIVLAASQDTLSIADVNDAESSEISMDHGSIRKREVGSDNTENSVDNEVVVETTENAENISETTEKEAIVSETTEAVVDTTTKRSCKKPHGKHSHHGHKGHGGRGHGFKHAHGHRRGPGNRHAKGIKHGHVSGGGNRLGRGLGHHKQHFRPRTGRGRGSKFN